MWGALTVDLRAATSRGGAYAAPWHPSPARHLLRDPASKAKQQAWAHPTNLATPRFRSRLAARHNVATHTLALQGAHALREEHWRNHTMRTHMRLQAAATRRAHSAREASDHRAVSSLHAKLQQASARLDSTMRRLQLSEHHHPERATRPTAEPGHATSTEAVQAPSPRHPPAAPRHRPAPPPPPPRPAAASRPAASARGAASRAPHASHQPPSLTWRVSPSMTLVAGSAPAHTPAPAYAPQHAPPPAVPSAAAPPYSTFNEDLHDLLTQRAVQSEAAEGGTTTASALAPHPPRHRPPPSPRAGGRLGAVASGNVAAASAAAQAASALNATPRAAPKLSERLQRDLASSGGKDQASLQYMEPAGGARGMPAGPWSSPPPSDARRAVAEPGSASALSIKYELLHTAMCHFGAPTPYQRRAEPYGEARGGVPTNVSSFCLDVPLSPLPHTCSHSMHPPPPPPTAPPHRLPRRPLPHPPPACIPIEPRVCASRDVYVCGRAGADLHGSGRITRDQLHQGLRHFKLETMSLQHALQLAESCEHATRAHAHAPKSLAMLCPCPCHKPMLARATHAHAMQHAHAHGHAHAHAHGHAHGHGHGHAHVSPSLATTRLAHRYR